jgi:hypothetical protein
MHSTTVTLAFAAQAIAWSVRTADAIGAPVATGQPLGVTYKATFQLGKPGTGYVAGSTNQNGIGVDFNIGITDLPDEGPFGEYRLIERP